VIHYKTNLVIFSALITDKTIFIDHWSVYCKMDMCPMVVVVLLHLSLNRKTWSV